MVLLIYVFSAGTTPEQKHHHVWSVYMKWKKVNLRDIHGVRVYGDPEAIRIPRHLLPHFLRKMLYRKTVAYEVIEGAAEIGYYVGYITNNRSMRIYCDIQFGKFFKFARGTNDCRVFVIDPDNKEITIMLARRDQEQDYADAFIIY